MRFTTLPNLLRFGSKDDDKSRQICKSGFLTPIASLLILVLFLLTSFQVHAQHPYGFIDGNVSASDDDLDWEDVWNAQQAGDFSTLPAGSITTGILFDGKAPDSIFTGGGTKDHLPINGANASKSWQWKSQDGSSSDKTNIQEAGAILINGVIYFFGNRFSNDGTTTIGFWFFKDVVGPIANGRFSGQHQDGDVLVVADISNGGAVEIIDAYRWVGEGNGTLPSSTKSMIKIGTDDTELAARVNRFDQETPWPHKSKNTDAGIMPPISFFEGFIDVKGLDLINACFSSFLVETRSSNPVSSILEDFTGGLFNVQPIVSIEDIAACESETPVTLTAMTEGGIPPLVYVWKKDGGIISGESSETLEVSESGTYSVTVTGSGVGGIGTCPSLEDTAEVIIYDNPDLTVEDLADCEDGTSGAQSFDLNDAVTEADGGSLSFYTSEADADGASSAIGDPTNVSVNIGTTTYWARSDNDEDGDEGCYSIASFDVSVYDNPDLTVEDLADCEDGTSGAQSFDLNDAVTEADGGSLSFYTSEADADGASSAIGDPTNVSVNIGTTTYWARSDNDEDGDEGCYSIASFDVSVYDNPDLTVEDLADCEDGTSGAQSFDLNDAVTEADGGSLSFYTSEADADGASSAIGDPTNVSVNIGTTTYWTRSDNDEDGDEGCYSIASFDVSVYDNPDVTTTNPPAICDGESVDLAAYVTEADGGTVSFHSSQADADNDMNALASSLVSPGIGSTTYYVRSGNQTDATCYGTATIIVTVESCLDQGCTLGYWKEHTNRWCDKYTTCMLYEDIFTSAPAEFKDADLTLLQALNLGGGDIYNLARQSVAALLNICSDGVSYSYPGGETQLITDVNNAFDGIGEFNAGTKATQLDGYNNAGCPLGGTSATEAPSPSCVNSALTLKAEESSDIINGFIASPVPFKESLTIQYDFEYTSNVTIQVYDIRGQLLRSYKDNKVTKGDITELDVDFRMKANQVYILRVATDRDVFSKSVISAKR